MRSASVDTPNLFDPANLAEKPQTMVLAEDFVRWCWSVGSDFRNSPDLTNLRFWLSKSDIHPSPSESGDILAEARRLSLERTALAVRKADVGKVTD